MNKELTELKKIEDFNKVIRLEQNKDGQWFVAFMNGAVGKIDLISLLKDLTTPPHDEIKREAVKEFIDSLAFNTYYDQEDLLQEYLTQQSLNKGDK